MQMRPRGVRMMKPSCIRYGSTTSSMVTASSPVVAASGKKVQEAVSSGQLQGQLRSFLYERTKRRPVVMINLIEVDS